MVVCTGQSNVSILAKAARLLEPLRTPGQRVSPPKTLNYLPEYTPHRFRRTNLALLPSLRVLARFIPALPVMALNAYLNSTLCLLDLGPSSLTRSQEKVSVLTQDGRTMVGTLTSCDGSLNLVLADAVERIIRPREEEVPSEEVPLGLYIIRGDSVAVVGRVDEELDASITWANVHGEVLGTTKHV